MPSIRPVRPNAVASLITTDDFLPGLKTMLYSLKENLPKEVSEDYYPPELVVLHTPNISQIVKDELYPAFCMRLIEVEPISIENCSETETESSNNCSHVSAWSEKCGYTKLHIFRQNVYGKVLYIDSDCLVQKDISHLFKVEPSNSRGLIAAAPDIFPPDKFNAGVILIEPSQKVFDDLLLKTKSIITYDGGDTGFLNSYFDDWHSYPSEGRLGFQYNAQRFMHQCTYEKQPKYWDMAVGDIYIIHYSSSPKPWQTEDSSNKLQSSQSDFLNKEDAEIVAKCESKSRELDKLWSKYYKKSILYKEEFEETQKLEKKRRVVKAKKPSPAKLAAPQGSAKKKTALTFNKRFKELRKEGLDSKAAMKQARQEFGMDKDDCVSAGKKVASMFGMPL